MESFLEGGFSLVNEEPGTIQFGPATFGLLADFPDESGREACLSVKVAAALMENVGEIIEGEIIEGPTIEQVGLIASKLPG